MNPVLPASLSVGTRSGMIIPKEKNGYYTIWFLMCVCFYFYRIKSSWKWWRRDSKLFLFNADQCGWVEYNTTFAREQFVWTVITILIWGECRKCCHIDYRLQAMAMATSRKWSLKKESGTFGFLWKWSHIFYFLHVREFFQEMNSLLRSLSLQGREVWSTLYSKTVESADNKPLACFRWPEHPKFNQQTFLKNMDCLWASIVAIKFLLSCSL